MLACILFISCTTQNMQKPQTSLRTSKTAIDVTQCPYCKIGSCEVNDCNMAICNNCKHMVFLFCEHQAAITKSQGAQKARPVVQKNCPQCSTPNSKQEYALNDIICSNCHFKFCWLCLEKWTGYGHMCPGTTIPTCTFDSIIQAHTCGSHPCNFW